MNRREVLGYAAASAAAYTVAPGHVLAGPDQAPPGHPTGQARDPAKAATGAYNVRDFGATGDGKTLDKQAINKTIEACSAAGGGTVLFPAGVYRTGSVHLKSDLTLSLSAGATILGSENLKDYDDLIGTGKTPNWHAALIVGQGLHNVAITGRGVVDGNNVFDPEGEEKVRGPMGIFFHKCEGTTIQDITVKNAGNYAHLMDDCFRCYMRGVTVTGPSDAVHMLNCKDFIITDCYFVTGDDCVAGGGLERLVVANCNLNCSCNAVRLSEGSGRETIDPNGIKGLRNVAFSNLVIWGPGVYELKISGRHDLRSAFNLTGGDNVTISNVSVSGARSPLWMNLRPDGVMRNVSINNLTATGVGRPQFPASIIQGLQDNPIESISLSNVTIVSEGGGPKDLLGSIPFHINAESYYSLPTYGLLCRYIRDLDLHNVRFRYSVKEARPALICENIERLELDGVRGQPGTESETSIELRDIKTLRARDSEVLPK